MCVRIRRHNVDELGARISRNIFMQMTEEMLLKDGFTEPRRYQCLIGEVDGRSVAYAIYFFSYRFIPIFALL